MEGTGTVGLVVVGLGGVRSWLLTGVLAARAHLVHPFGSLAEGGGSGRAPGFGPSPLRAAAPLAELGDLALGAFEVREDDPYRAALRAGLVSRSLVDELRPELRKIHAMIGGRQAPTRRHLAYGLAEDLRGFLAYDRCARGVVVCTLPGVRAAPAKQAFSASEVREALEQNADWITPGVVYAAAAAEAGCAFVAAGPDRALCAPGISALFAEKSLPVAGAGLLGPDALLRETLGQILAMEGMQLAGAASLSTARRSAAPPSGADPIAPPRWGSARRGRAAPFELSLELRGPVGLYLAARALDAALLVELAARAQRSGAQEWTRSSFRRSGPHRRTRRGRCRWPAGAGVCWPSCRRSRAVPAGRRRSGPAARFPSRKNGGSQPGPPGSSPP